MCAVTHVTGPSPVEYNLLVTPTDWQLPYAKPFNLKKGAETCSQTFTRDVCCAQHTMRLATSVWNSEDDETADGKTMRCKMVISEHTAHVAASSFI